MCRTRMKSKQEARRQLESGVLDFRSRIRCVCFFFLLEIKFEKILG